MKHAYTIGDRQFIFETVPHKRGFRCQCLEYPQIRAHGSTAKRAIDACVNTLSSTLGLQKVKVVKTIKRRRIILPHKPSKPWWRFW